MTGHRRKLLLDTLLLGVALTLVVLLADHFGLLATLENLAFDKRARVCQFFTPAPTDKLVHLDIDDRSQEVIGQWPWPRSVQARMLDAVADAGAKVIALDVVYSAPKKDGGVDSAEGVESPKPAVAALDPNDADFAATLRRSGNVIVPLQLLGSEAHDAPVEQAMLRELIADLELSEPELAARLKGAGFPPLDVDAAMKNAFFILRRQAAFTRVRQLLESNDSSLDLVTAALLKKESAAVAHGATLTVQSPLRRLIQEQYEHARAARAMRRLAIALPASCPPVLRVPEIYQLPLSAFAEAAAGTGSVDYRFGGDPVVRAAPMVIAQGDRLYPQLGLAMACAALDVAPASIEFKPDEIVVPLPKSAAIHVPVRTVTSRVSRVPMVAYVPWFGGGDWKTMYDWPHHVETRKHLPFTKVWDVVQSRERIVFNNRNCDKAIEVILDDDPPPPPGAKEVVKTHLAVDPAKYAKYKAALPPLDDVEARQATAQACLTELQTLGWIEGLEDLERKGEIKADERAQLNQLRDARAALRQTLGQSRELQKQLTSVRQELRTLLGGKTVLIGYADSASVADSISTSIHDKCPGVVVHGAIFNAIMTNHFWRAAPTWVTPVMTLALGVLTAAASAWMSTIRALLAAVAMLGAYLVLNGVMMFDRYGVVVGIAGPATAVVLVWAGCVVVRTLIETRERAIITKHLQSRADPTLVEYVLEHPERVTFAGEVKEITVAFTDLANFTTLSEKLGEKSVALLNDYMSRMVPIVRARLGYLNKFLGDGIMFFFGAPRESATHAADAVHTALEMQKAMTAVNDELAQQGLPLLGMRIGISTGRMVVGDAGSAERSDYTVLGDAVNFGSRLEGANKYLGTRVLVSERTAEQAAKEFLFNYVGRLRVVGKTQGVGVYEAVCTAAEATDAQRRYVALTQVMVTAYQSRQFADTIAAADDLDAFLGTHTKLAAAYRDRAKAFLDQPPGDDFDGTLSLTEK